MFSASPKKLKQEAKSKNGKLSSSEKQTTAATSIAGSNEKVTEIQADQMHLDAALKESQFMFKQEEAARKASEEYEENQLKFAKQEAAADAFLAAGVTPKFLDFGSTEESKEPLPPPTNDIMSVSSDDEEDRERKERETHKRLAAFKIAPSADETVTESDN